MPSLTKTTIFRSEFVTVGFAVYGLLNPQPETRNRPLETP